MDGVLPQVPGARMATVAIEYQRARAWARADLWILALVLSGYVAGTAALAWTRMPQPDEGHFASAGYELAHHGRLAMPMWTAWVSSLDRHMYVQMPLYYVQLAGWITAFGPDLRAIRFNSALWGVVLVLAWFVILQAIGRDRITPLLGFMLIGFNYDIMNTTSARYDPMCAALSAAGVACYLGWRQRHLLRAVAAANVCLAAAVMTHPFGVVGIAGFVLFFAALDLRRLSFSLVAAGMAPYMVAFGAWGLYVMQDPVAFSSQLSANAHGRVGNLSNPLQMLALELRERYLERFAGWRPDVPVLMRVKVFLLVAYLAGAAGCLASAALRRRREVLALVAWGVAAFAIIAVADNSRSYIYLLHTLPIYTAILALWLGSMWSRSRAGRSLVIAAAAGWVLFSIGTVGLRVRLNDYDRLYVPTLSYLQAHVKRGDLVMAGGEFGPGLGFADHVLDDRKFGYRSGRTPAWIVHDKLDEDRMAQLARTEPALRQHIERMLSGYQLVLDNRQPYNYYRVYRRPENGR